MRVPFFLVRENGKKKEKRIGEAATRRNNVGNMQMKEPSRVHSNSATNSVAKNLILGVVYMLSVPSYGNKYGNF